MARIAARSRSPSSPSSSSLRGATNRPGAAARVGVDVMLVYEAELDPDDAQPPIGLAGLEAKLDAAE